MDVDPFFAPSFVLLQHESMLTESCLAAGLTAIRNGALTDKGKLLSGFFNLSIGCERLFKLVLVVDYMIENKMARPTNEWLKGFGHDLVRLHSAVQALGSAAGIIKPLASRESQILAFLAKFAKRSRYYNLDTLTYVDAGYSPLSEWGHILEQAIEYDVSRRRIERIEMESTVMSHLLQGSAMVMMHDLDGRPLDLHGAMRQPRLQLEAAPHVVLRLLCILAPVRQVLYELGHRAYEVTPTIDGERKMHIPDFADVLIFLHEPDRRTALRKKRWP